MNVDRRRKLQTIFFLSRLLPKGPQVIVIGQHGELLAEGLGKRSLHVDSGQIVDSASLGALGPVTQQIALLAEDIELCLEYPSLVRIFADSCIPFVYATQRSEAECEGSLGRVIEERFEILRFRNDNGMYLCFAMPLIGLRPLWLQSHAVQLRLRLEAQITAERASSEGIVPFLNSWGKRDEIVAGWVPRGLAIADVGCGAMNAEALLHPCSYFPIDHVKRDDRTIVLDLNSERLPDDCLVEVELVLFLGVLEYLDDPLQHLAQVASHAKRMVITYNIFEKRTRLAQLTGGNWRSTLHDEDLRTAFLDYGYEIEASAEMGRQTLYLVKPKGMPPLRL
ncbi:hypothetical protein [Cyanobium sp. Morenito 9A2]|uniref:hypothetical protein n=1 Tax=Cyanobium sp. Morenito 9A2 TaxID=2823718 RepID=UPI0020CF9A5F|nr:hypothetical protein [Cyanobium sp. Morenito 9A2]MCP9851128.1 hypothetical protein [Cyanobium sp. Morenito 9A2]